MIQLPFLILELHFLVLRMSDSGGGARWGVGVNQFGSVPVANEWEAVGSDGERVFFSSQLVV